MSSSSGGNQLAPVNSIPDVNIPISVSLGLSCGNCHAFPSRSSSSASTLLCCSACYSINYCNHSCQKSSWKTHQHTCKLLKKMIQYQSNLSSSESAMNWNEWIEYVELKIQLSKQIMMAMPNRSEEILHKINMSSCSFLPKCDYCYRERRKERRLEWNCHICKARFICKECEQGMKEEEKEKERKHHELHCSEYTVMIEGEQLGKTHGHKFKLWVGSGRIDPSPVVSFSQLDAASNSDPFTAWKAFLSMYSTSTAVDVNSASFAIQSNALSIALTLFATLQRNQLISPIPSSSSSSSSSSATEKPSTDTLTIHLIGVSIDYEVIYHNMFELLLHLLPVSVKSLNFILVSPSLDLSYFPGSTFSVTPMTIREEIPPLCAECKAKSCRIHIRLYKGLYHEYLATSHSSSPPDLIFLFHPGLHLSSSLFPSWPLTLSAIAEQMKRSGTPVTLTAFTKEEAEKSEAILKQNGMEVKVSLQNLWKGLQGRLEPLAKNTTHVKTVGEESFCPLFAYRNCVVMDAKLKQ